MTRRTVADEPIGVEENLLMFSTFIIPNHAYDLDTIHDSAMR